MNDDNDDGWTVISKKPRKQKNANNSNGRPEPNQSKKSTNTKKVAIDSKISKSTHFEINPELEGKVDLHPRGTRKGMKDIHRTGNTLKFNYQDFWSDRESTSIIKVEIPVLEENPKISANERRADERRRVFKIPEKDKNLTVKRDEDRKAIVNYVSVNQNKKNMWKKQGVKQVTKDKTSLTPLPDQDLNEEELAEIFAATKITTNEREKPQFRSDTNGRYSPEYYLGIRKNEQTKRRHEREEHLKTTLAGK